MLPGLLVLSASLCNLSVLCVSVVSGQQDTKITTQTQRTLGSSQYHLAVAGGYGVSRSIANTSSAPTRYREVVLTASNFVSQTLTKSPQSETAKKQLGIENIEALAKFFQTLASAQTKQRIEIGRASCRERV